MRRTGRIYAVDEHAVIMSVGIVDAPLDVAEALQIPAGSRVIRRHRVTYRGETPTSVSMSWYVAELAEARPHC